MLVGVLITIMISIVVGVSLVPTIVSSINSARIYVYGNGTAAVITGNATGAYQGVPNAPVGLGGLLDTLSYVFVAVILLGAVSWIGGQG